MDYIDNIDNNNNYKKINDYNYNAINNLQYTSLQDILLQDILLQDIIDKIQNKKIYLCSYTINNEGMYPFLNFLLYKNSNNINYLNNSTSEEKLNFPLIDNSIFLMDFETMLSFSKNYLYNLLKETNYEKKNDFENFVNYKGITFFENNVYVFFDLTECNIKNYDIYKKNKLWFCLVDEIMNIKNVCNISINTDVTNFFIKNNHFLYLYDSSNIKYNIPSVAYIGKTKKYLNFTYIFGVSKSDNHATLGPYYYFTDFSNAIEEIKIDNKNEEIGIIRFAIFTNTILIKENFVNDENDVSELKKERINDQMMDINYEALTIRISDHDGKWTENYDSVYLGNIELDNGKYLKNTPIIVLKKYEQQLSLSYHYINKKSLLDEYAIL